MKLTTFGKEAGRPHFVYVDNSLVVDPTFFDKRTKSILNQSRYDVH